MGERLVDCARAATAARKTELLESAARKTRYANQAYERSKIALIAAIKKAATSGLSMAQIELKAYDITSEEALSRFEERLGV